MPASEGRVVWCKRSLAAALRHFGRALPPALQLMVQRGQYPVRINQPAAPACPALLALRAGLFNCPLAMTDGAARLCELLLPGQGQGGSSQQQELAAALRDTFRHLTSRDPQQFWTSGQVCMLGGQRPWSIVQAVSSGMPMRVPSALPFLPCCSG